MRPNQRHRQVKLTSPVADLHATPIIGPAQAGHALTLAARIGSDAYLGAAAEVPGAGLPNKVTSRTEAVLGQPTLTGVLGQPFGRGTLVERGTSLADSEPKLITETFSSSKYLGQLQSSSANVFPRSSRRASATDGTASYLCVDLREPLDRVVLCAATRLLSVLAKSGSEPNGIRVRGIV